MSLSKFSVSRVSICLLNGLVPDRPSEWDDMYYVCWLDMLYGGVKGLQFFDAEKKVWG